MKLKDIINEWIDEIPIGKIGKLPIGALLMTKEEIAEAVSNLSRGMSSMTKGPLIVCHRPEVNKFQLTNGYHRVVEALMRGEGEVEVFHKGEATWKPPSKSNTFRPDWDSDYYGMEEFIEHHVLRDL